MKKLLAFILSVVSIGFIASFTTANANEPVANMAATNAAAPQITIRIGKGRRNRRRGNRHVRSVTQTRLVRYGRHTFRETYQVTYLSDGRTQTRLISRTRLS